jgi:hypothetical protein
MAAAGGLPSVAEKAARESSVGGPVAGGLPNTGELHLVKVAYASNLPEAELIQSLLRQEHIPSMTRRNGGFDIPDFIAAGPRDVLVPVSQADRARELLA